MYHTRYEGRRECSDLINIDLEGCTKHERVKDIMYIIGSVFSVLLYLVIVDLFNNSKLKKETLPKLKRSNTVAIGNGANGVIYHNFNKFPHMIIAGTTGYGKTNFINCLVAQLDADIVLIDLKDGDDFEVTSATDIYGAERHLSEVVRTMKEKRERHLFVIIDEAGQMIPPSYVKKDHEKEPYLKCLEYCSEIARLGRSRKVHLIFCTQYPTADILPRQIKSCADSRICFRLPTSIQSGVAIDESGAEELPFGEYGLGIYKTDRKQLVQTFLYEGRENDYEYVRQEQEKTRDNFIIFE